MKPFVMLLLMGVAAALVVTPGCATVPDPDPPDLSPSEQAVEMRLRSIDASQESILADIERLQDLTEGLTSLLKVLGPTELPHSLLRLVAMNCLNTEYQGLTTPVAGLEGTPLTCRPTHAPQLLERLDQVSTSSRDDALQLLYVIDQARILRGSLRLRLSNIPDIITEHRDFIADERAMLRQLETDLRRRRGRYSTRGWRETMTRLDDHRQHLQELDQRLEEFGETYPAWPSQVDQAMAQIYFELVELREHSENSPNPAPGDSPR